MFKEESNILIVYFSLNGHTKAVVEKMAKELEADTYPIKLKKELPPNNPGRFMKALVMGIFDKRPLIKRGGPKPGNYDIVIFGSPLWGGQIVPPMRTYLESHQLKLARTAIFVCSGGSGSGKWKENYRELIEKNEIIIEDQFSQKEMRDNRSGYEARIKKFAKKIRKKLDELEKEAVKQEGKGKGKK